MLNNIRWGLSCQACQHVELLQSPNWVTRGCRTAVTIVTFFDQTGFPLGLENLEKWEGIFQSGKSQGILNRLEKSGKNSQNTGKLREFQKKIICYFSMIFK